MASTRTGTPPANKRLLKELQAHAKEPNANLSQLGPVSDAQFLHWEAVMIGPKGGAYEYGVWKLDIQIPDKFPNAPPTIRFVTNICHPNVNFKV
jgi:peroxin-4